MIADASVQPGAVVIRGAAAAALGLAAGAVATGAADPVLAVAGLAGLATAVAVVLRPAVGLPVIAVFAVLRLADVATDFHGAPSTFTPLVALLLAAVVIRWLTTAERPAGAGRVVLVAGPFVLVAVGSLLWAGDPTTSTSAAEALVKDGAVAVIVGLLLHRPRDLRATVWAIVLAGGAVATVTSAQFLLGAFDTTVFGFAQSEVQNIVGATDDVRISGPIGDPNYYAQFLVMIVPLAYERWRTAAPGPLRLAAAWATVATGASTVFTFSRGGALAIAVVAVIVLVRFRPSRSMIVAAVVGTVALLPLLPPGYVERLTTLDQVGTIEASTDASIRGRTSVLRAGTAMFLDAPLRGVGYGGFQDAYVDYARGFGIEVSADPREAHNLYLEIAAETGMAGLAAFGVLVAGVAAALRTARRSFRAAGRDDLEGIAYALGASLLGYLLTSIFLHMAFARFAWLLAGVALALPAVAAGVHADSGPATSSREAAWT